jgi:hypothetical protein
MIIDGYDYISESEFSFVWLARAKPSGDLFSLDEISPIPVELVWTVLEAESHNGGDLKTASSWYASPGIHRVNALGYVVTEKPWRDDTPDAIWYLDDGD